MSRPRFLRLAVFTASPFCCQAGYLPPLCRLGLDRPEAEEEGSFRHLLFGVLVTILLQAREAPDAHNEHPVPDLQGDHQRLFGHRDLEAVALPCGVEGRAVLRVAARRVPLVEEALHLLDLQRPARNVRRRGEHAVGDSEAKIHRHGTFLHPRTPGRGSAHSAVSRNCRYNTLCATFVNIYNYKLKYTVLQNDFVIVEYSEYAIFLYMNELQNKSQEESALSNVLPQDEASAFLLLLRDGPLRASTLAKKLHVQRPTAYKLLEKLVEKELAVNNNPGKGVATYSPKHPAQLQMQAQQQAREAKATLSLIDAYLPALTEEFHSRFGGIPGFRVLNGLDGLQTLYEEIITEQKNILLMRSPHDRQTTEARLLINAQIRAQIEHSIHTRALTPLRPDIDPALLENDATNLVERRILPEEEFLIPAQVIVYGSKVGITDYEDTFMTTIIDNEAIAQTFTIIFNYIWDKSLDTHNKMLPK